MASTWGDSFGVAWGVSWDISTAVVAVEEVNQKNAGPAPGSYKNKRKPLFVPDRYYSPPLEKIAKKKKKELTAADAKKVYSEARKTVAKEDQEFLLPEHLRVKPGYRKVLPPATYVDFTKLAKNMEIISELLRQVAIANYQREIMEEEMRLVRRRKDEESAIIMILMEA